MPGLIPDAEMAAIRATAESSFDQTVIQRRNTAGKSSYGTKKSTWTLVNAALKCRIGPPSGPLLSAIAEKIGSQKVWILTVADAGDVREGDQIQQGTDVMYVHNIIAPTSYSTATQFVCGEVL